jgi:hypothetical protein
MAKTKSQQLRMGRETLERLPVSGATWHVWTADEDDGQAAAAFERRHGQPPEHVVERAGYLWLGPVPGLEVKL